jgi:RNA polymerase sigma-70 factor (ECF subfamily)
MPSNVEEIYRTESRHVLATLIRLLGDFELAEDAMHDAFRVALEQWPKDGVPDHPRAWLVSTGRFKGIDRLRKQARADVPLDSLTNLAEPPVWEDSEPSEFPDDRLRLIFTCGHPALAPDARAALTLREVCGLTTEEIASAFLTTAPTIAQRIVRAKNKIKEAQIPYEIPTAEKLPERLGTVLQVIYLVFNEGYSASSGASLTRADLSTEAIRLGRLLMELMLEPEVLGLLALMLIQESRRTARTSLDGDLILLDQQDRSLWNHWLIKEGQELVERALRTHRFGPYSLQAAIAAVHAEADDTNTTDWAQIIALYDVLSRMDSSPVVELNRAVAVAMRDGPIAGLVLVNDLLARGVLDDYHFIHSVRADLCRRMGNVEEARLSYKEALAMAKQEPERRFLQQRLDELH